ncbi:MAG: cytochrome P450 [Sneathiella sp.]
MELLLTLTEILLLSLLPWPVWQLFMLEARKEYHASPSVNKKYVNLLTRGRARKILFILILYAGFLFLVSYIAQPALHLMAIAGVLIAIAYDFRSKPDYGKRSSIPPGSLKLFPLSAATNDMFFLDQTREFGPIFKISSPPDHRYLSMRPMVCITDLKLGRNFLRQHDKSLRLEPVAPFSLQFESGLLRNMSETDHLKYSKLHHTAYSALNTSDVLEICTTEARNILQAMEKDGGVSAEIGVDPRPYFDQMMYNILAQVLFGITPGSEDFAELEKLSLKLDLIRVQRNTKTSDFRPKLDEFIEFLQRCFEKFSAPKYQPSRFKPVIVLLAENAPEAIVDRNVLCNLINDFWSGRIDTTGLLTWTIKFLSDNQDWREKYTNRLANSNHPYQSENIVKEVLRLSQSEWLLRRTTSEVNFGKFRIPKNWNIRVCVREAHRDANIFECPHDFNPARFDDKNLTPSVYSPFGLHKHKCVGWKISHAAVIGLIENLSHEFNFSKTDDGPLTHLWLHWAPSRQLKIKVTHEVDPSFTLPEEPALQS